MTREERERREREEGEGRGESGTRPTLEAAVN